MSGRPAVGKSFLAVRQRHRTASARSSHRDRRFLSARRGHAGTL